ARPAAGFEHRVLRKLRQAPASRRQGWSGFTKLSAAAAAVVFLGALGAALNTVMENGRLPFPGEWGQTADAQKRNADKLKQVVAAEGLVGPNVNEPLRKVAELEYGRAASIA